MGEACQIARYGTDPAATKLAWRQQAACGDWLDISKTRRCLWLLLVFQLGLFSFLFAGTHGWIVPLPHPASPDFVSFYAAGALTDGGHATAAYDRAMHFAAQEAVLGHGIDYQYFLYPPPFLLVCAALARLPWAWSFLAFDAITLLGCLAVLQAMLQVRLRDCIFPLLAFPAIGWVLLLGQNSFLTAGLFGSALLLLERRPVLAGLLIACLSYKPHFALLIPLALAAGGHWRCFAAAATGLLALCAVCTVLFGTDVWTAYLGYFSGAQAEIQAGQVGRFGAMATLYGALRSFGVPHGTALLGQAAASLAAAGGVALLWRRRAAFPLRAAALVSGTLAAVPFALFYDVTLALVALCWLVRHGRATGFPPWSKSVMAICWMIPMLVLAVLFSGEIAAGALVGPALLLLCWHWHLSERGGQTSPAQPFTMMQPPSAIGRNALSAGMVESIR